MISPSLNNILHVSILSSRALMGPRPTLQILLRLEVFEPLFASPSPLQQTLGLHRSTFFWLDRTMDLIDPHNMCAQVYMSPFRFYVPRSSSRLWTPCRRMENPCLLALRLPCLRSTFLLLCMWLSKTSAEEVSSCVEIPIMR